MCQNSVNLAPSILQSEPKFNFDVHSMISFGFGFKFGLIGNQIDLSYRFGNREGLNLKETIQNLNISISLGDIWFLKRRN